MQDEAKQVMALVQRLALEVVAMRPAQREEGYARIERAFRDTAKQVGQPEDKAAENAAELVGFVETLVEIMERGGGAHGGRA